MVNYQGSSFEKELERQRLAGECCADTIQKEIDRLAAVSSVAVISKPKISWRKEMEVDEACGYDTERLLPIVEGTNKNAVISKPKIS